MTARRPPRFTVRFRSLRGPLSGLLTAAALIASAAPADAAVECDRSKKYRLNRNHGPWVIMVATFHPLRGGNPNGTTPEEAADTLVYELRDQGVPAEAWVVPSRTETVESVGKAGDEQNRVYAAMRGGVVVMAGNFKSADDPKAARSLKWIKEKCRVPSLEPVAGRGWTGVTKAGGFFKLTPGRKSPLSHAILTVNPLLTAAERKTLTRRRDPLLVRLNGGREYGLADCGGTHTVVVAQFRGKVLTQVRGTKSEDVGERVELSNDLDEAGKKAWELCQVLRQRGSEAYVWHDRHRSLVSVGAFRGPRDPAALRAARKFAARPVGASPIPQPQTVVVPEGETDLRKARRYWLLDPNPYVMEVPAL